LWIIGPVTVLAVALIIFAVVLGIRAGQRQIEIQRRQEVGIALQRAVDFQSEGRLEEALAEYRRVLILDPGNEAALAGVQALGAGENVVLIPATTPDAATADGATTPAPAAVIAPTAAPTSDAQTQSLYEQARAVYSRGQWEEAVTLLVQLQTQAPTFEADQVEEMLYNCYVNLAAAADQADQLDAAIVYVDKALAIRPNAALSAARTLAANYVEAVRIQTTDPGRAVELLSAVYAQDPSYRDVAERLQTARLAYGDKLALEKEWCLAEEQYTLAIEISVLPGTIARRDDFQARCAQLLALRGQGPTTPTPTPTTAVAAASATPALGQPSPTPAAAATLATDTAAPNAAPNATAEATATPEPTAAPVAGPVGGRIAYAAIDPNTGANTIFVQPAAGGGAQALFTGVTQPAYRPDQQRIAFRDLRNESRGISTLDPASGLELRFTTFAEDSDPTWNNLGNLIAFASNREGDRRWRIYVLWADVNNEAVGMGFGQYPDWDPTSDRLAYQGCDDSGNNCGLRVMNSSGGNRGGLTSVAADMQPDWAATGAFVAFAS
jgi:tetratricopeptide (TPR) repeat protein